MSGFVGVDVAKNTFDIATHLPNGKHKTKAKLANNPKGFKEFEAWLDTNVERSALIVMEATSVYHLELAEFVYNKGFRVCVVNPATTKAYADSELRRIKTDKSDAKLIADFAREKDQKLQPWVPEPLKYRQLKAMVRRLDDLKWSKWSLIVWTCLTKRSKARSTPFCAISKKRSLKHIRRSKSTSMTTRICVRCGI